MHFWRSFFTGHAVGTIYLFRPNEQNSALVIQCSVPCYFSEFSQILRFAYCPSLFYSPDKTNSPVKTILLSIGSSLCSIALRLWTDAPSVCNLWDYPVNKQNRTDQMFPGNNGPPYRRNDASIMVSEPGYFPACLKNTQSIC